MEKIVGTDYLFNISHNIRYHLFFHLMLSISIIKFLDIYLLLLKR